MPKVVTKGQLAEGYVEFHNGVIVKRRFRAVDRTYDGNYVVEWPPAPPDEPETRAGEFPIVDARSPSYYA